MSTILIEPSLPTLRALAESDPQGVYAAFGKLLVAENALENLPDSQSKQRALDRINTKWRTLAAEHDVILFPSAD
mgnify:CR=1 FL=1